MKRVFFYLTYIRRGASFARFTAELSAHGGKLSVDLDGLSFLGRQFVTEPRDPVSSDRAESGLFAGPGRPIFGDAGSSH